MHKDTLITVNNIRLSNDEVELVIDSLLIMGQWIERIQGNEEIGTINKIERDLDYINDSNNNSHNHPVAVAYLSIENFNYKVCIVSHCSIDPEVEGFGACLVDSNNYAMVKPKTDDEMKLLSIIDSSFPFSTMHVPKTNEEGDITNATY